MMHRIKDAFTYELRKRHKCSLLFEGIITSFASVIKTVSGNERQFRCFIIIFEMKDEKKKGNYHADNVKCSDQFFRLIRFVSSNN